MKHRFFLHSIVCSLLCITLCTSCHFNMGSESLREWRDNLNNHNEDTYTDDRVGWNHFTTYYDLHGLQYNFYHFASNFYYKFDLNVNSPGGKYVVGMTNDAFSGITIELYKLDGTLITSYPATSPKPFTTSESKITIRFVNRTEHDVSLDDPCKLYMTEFHRYDTPLGLSFANGLKSGALTYRQIITINKNIPGYVSSYYLTLPTPARYTIDATASRNGGRIKLDYVNYYDGSFSGDRGVLNAEYTIGNPTVFNTVNPPQDYISSPIRLELFGIQLSASDYYQDYRVETIIIEADRPFEEASLELIHDWF